MATIRHHLHHFRHRAVHHARNAFIPHEGNNFHPHALRKTSLHIVGGTLVLVKVVSVLFVTLYAGQAHVTTISPQTIVSQTNSARTSRGLTKLSTNALLTKAAQAKANDMVTKGYFAHISPTKVTPWYWFKKAGYSYTYAGENLAIDYSSSEDVISAWLNSPTHRANVLSSRYKEIGVATATGVINGAESMIIVQMFGAPVPTKPKPVATKPAQTPTPSSVKPVAVKKPTVLGTEIAKVQTPTLRTPAPGTYVRTAKPTFVGTASPRSRVMVSVGETLVGSVTADAAGNFTLTPAQPLPDGPATIKISSERDGIQSTVSTSTMTVDTTAPEYSASASSMVRVLTDPSAYIMTIASDATAVDVVGGTVFGPFRQMTRSLQMALVQIDRRGPMAGVISVRLADVAGNVTDVAVVNTDRFETVALNAPNGPAARALTMVFFSRAFLMTFFGIFLAVALVNVTMNWRRRHHPALLGLLLVLYTAGTLLIL